MPTYILLSSLTNEGRKTLKERPERLREVNAELVAMGGRLLQQHALLGGYDFLNIVEAPDNETITRISVELGSRGTLRLTTLPAVAATARPAPKAGRPFAVFTRLTPDGRRALSEDPDRLAQIEAEVERLGATITHQFRVLGEYDYITLACAPDNETAARVAAEVSSLGTVHLQTHPAIPIERFTKLLEQRAYRTDPHTWQTQFWAGALRRVLRPWVMTRHVRRYCRPLRVEGAEALRGFRGPALVIANHTSHFDTPAVISALPSALRERTAIAAAADRFYRNTKRSWWYSLFWNTFPIKRGGGKAALDYPMSLLERGWSILIYPEGGRSKPGRLGHFHHGVTIMAMMAKVPVVPIFLEGLDRVMPKGQRNPQPGPASVRIGAPVSLDGIEGVPDGTALLEDAMRALAAERAPREAEPGAATVPA